MAGGIGATIYKMGIDTSDFVGGSTLTRQELRMTKQIMKETADETAKYSAALDRVDNLVAKGAITLDQRRHVMADIHREQLRQIPIIGDMAANLHAMGPAGAAAAAGAAAFAVATREIGRSMEKIDQLLNTAENIGMVAGKFQELAAAAQLADIEQGQFSAGLEKMENAISKGAEGSAKLVKVFNLIGLDARELHSLDPSEQFEKISAALRGVENSADKVRAATAIFGSPDFARLNTSHIERAKANIEAMGAAIDKVRTENFGKMDDELTSLTQKWELFWQGQTLRGSGFAGAAAGGINQMIEASGIGRMNLMDTALGNLLLPGPLGADLGGRLGMMLRGGRQAIDGQPTGDQGAGVLDDVEAEEMERSEQMARINKIEAETRRVAEEATAEMKREKDVAETRKKLWDEGVAEWKKGHDAMFADMRKLEAAEDRAREVVEDMEKDRAKRDMDRADNARTVDVARRGSREAAMAVAQHRAPSIVRDPELTREQKKAVELLKRIAAGVEKPLTVMEETL